VIKIVDYDSMWPASFEQEQRRLLQVIGDLVDGIHHVGSTSVAGLAAKPKIDIDAVLGSDTAIGHAVDRLRALAIYCFHGDPYGAGLWTFTRAHHAYGVRLYLCGPGNATHGERVLFRDWLRTHPADAAAYAALKRRLALEAKDDWTRYSEGKADFVATIIRRASSQIDRHA
jgi:GrpB-like predicted nucleotidyltransferase (UPF0157 family)